MHTEADEARLIGLRRYRLIARDHDAFDAVAPDWHHPEPVEAMEADKDAARDESAWLEVSDACQKLFAWIAAIALASVVLFAASTFFALVIRT